MNKKYILNSLFTFFCVIFLIGCKTKNSNIERAFYFWKTSFDLNEKELAIIKENNISTLYIKYFDVVWNTELNSAVPVAKILFKQAVPQQLQIVPVVYITNNVLLKSNIDSINNLAISISKLIKNYQPIVKNNIAEIQIDCDWTVSTKAKYFALLNTIKSQFKKM
jgi:hypothetical protein